MANNRELSEFGSFVSVDNTTKNVGIATTVRITAGGLFVGAVQAIRPDGTWGGSTAGIQGAQGTGGVQGTTGTQGTQGAQGFNGTVGTQGATGTQGTTGAQGATGTQGTTGAQGTTGTQGATGTQGTTGTTGTQGTSGTATFPTSVQIQSTKANDTTTGGGQIYLNGASGNRIDFNQNGVAAPAFTTRSAGTKIVLYPIVGASSVDYAFGIDNNTLWYSVDGTSSSHKWYAATTNIATLTGTGNLQFNSGYGSVATAYGCRAWVRKNNGFDGLGNGIMGSANVTSLTQQATGRWTVNLTNAMPDTNYAVVATSFRNNSDSFENEDPTVRSTTAFTICLMNYSASRYDFGFSAAVIR